MLRLLERDRPFVEEIYARKEFSWATTGTHAPKAKAPKGGKGGFSVKKNDVFPVHSSTPVDPEESGSNPNLFDY